MGKVCRLGIGTSFILIATLGLSSPAKAENSTLNARQIVQESVQAMGGNPPSSSRLVGTASWVNGGTTESGATTILYKSTFHSKETFDWSSGRREIRLQNGDAAECKGGLCSPLPLEQSVTSFSVQFPLVWLQRALLTPEATFQYVGAETIHGVATHHIRFWDFNDPGFAKIWAASAKDLWVGVDSQLPVRLSFVQRMNWGGDEGVPVVVSFSDYRTTGGFLVPFQVERTQNGSPWITVQINQVEINVGLLDSEFSLQGDRE